jgi:glucan phosphorylase
MHPLPSPSHQSHPHPTKALLRRQQTKIKSKKLSYFSAAKNVRKFTTFTTHFTTLSPQKAPRQPPKFSKTPSKNHIFQPSTTPRKNCAKSTSPTAEPT